jgi:hypothetical protein
MHVMGVGTVADPIEPLGLQTFWDVVAAFVIATRGSADTIVITTIGDAIATGVVAGKDS